jgi:DNA-binding SARP family transcriptional activator
MGAPAAGLAIHLLGAPRIERGGQPTTPPRGNKAWALLAYLLRSETPATRRHLAALLFEEAEDPMAALRWSLSQLRRALGGASLQGDVLRLALEPTDYVDVDVVARGGWIEALCVPGLDGQLLEGMDFSSSPGFDVWLAAERRHIESTAEGVLHEAALARLARGAAAEAASLAGRLVRRNPLDERYQALLVRSLGQAGDRAGATRQVAACRELFARELGVQPGQTLQAAIGDIDTAPLLRCRTGRAGAVAQLDAGEAAIVAGALDAGLQCLRRAIVEADAGSDVALGARARVALGSALVHAARGRDDEGLGALREALAVAEAACPPVAAAACRELGRVEFLAGHYEHALVWVRRAERLVGGSTAERGRIATLHGATLSDTAHYARAIAVLREAEALSGGGADPRHLAYTLSMSGRALLLCGELDEATAALDRSVLLAQQGWTSFLPWPQSLRAEIDLLRGDVTAAAERLEHAFALGSQLEDPCWEGIAGRGLGLVAAARGDGAHAAEVLVDALARGDRLPDSYAWGKAHTLDALCGLAVTQGMPQAPAWIAELQLLAARTGMREFMARALIHRGALGDVASAAAATALVLEIDNPALRRMAARQGSPGVH